MPGEGALYGTLAGVSGLLIGYARCSTDDQDLTAQRDGLEALGVPLDRVYVDHGLTGTNRDRPGLREALAAARSGDTLVVTKLDRLARSVPDARAIETHCQPFAGRRTLANRDDAPVEAQITVDTQSLSVEGVAVAWLTRHRRNSR